MKLSAFNLYVEEFPDPGMTLIHNTFSGAYVVVDQRALNALRKENGGEPLSAEERALTHEPVWAETDVGIVVSSLEEEASEYQAWFHGRRSRREMQCIIGINLACNFDCTYCCQAEVMDGSVMKPEVIAETADWLASHAVARDIESVHVTFVGGEPLLHPERIKSLAARVQSRLDRHGIELTLGLITNGYFLTAEIVRELLPYGLTVAQVTLDGDRNTHALSRIAKNGEDTFSRIFANVIAASREIRVGINGNYQEHTVHGFAPLIDALAAAGLPAQSTLSFSPALEALDAPQGSAGGTCNWSSAPYGYRIALYDRILGRGYQASKLHSVGPCGFHDHHLFAIDPRGNIYKCPGFLGHPAWRIGQVASGLSEDYARMLAVDTSRACSGCAHHPNCGGGCVADKALRTNTLDVNCERTYLDAVTPHSLAREYLLATSESPDEAIAAFPKPPAALPGLLSPVRGVRSEALRVL